MVDAGQATTGARRLAAAQRVNWEPPRTRRLGSQPHPLEKGQHTHPRRRLCTEVRGQRHWQRPLTEERKAARDAATGTES